ncbi:hypothetical protein [Brevibacterium senegalense]|uniref:hypothetical protein n=1 Tax=Brevibacterium senegalense TaxID=1033736 RepID=UPI00037F77D2|nr:hypothetical protein [Brevibacterium senegalense]
MSQPPIPPPGQVFQTYGESQQYGPQTSPHTGTGGPSPGAHGSAGPGALALVLLLGGFALLPIPAILIPVFNVTGLADPVSVGFTVFSVGLGVVARLIGITGVLVVRSATWARRGIAAGILAASTVVVYVGQFVLHLVIQQMVGAAGPELVGTISTAGSAVLGLLSAASWVVAWLVVRRAPRAAWCTALPVALVLPAICTMLVNVGLAFVFGGGLYLFATMGNAVMALPFFVAAVVFAEFLTRGARRRTQT